MRSRFWAVSCAIEAVSAEAATGTFECANPTGLHGGRKICH
jgi:hypothetical protein